MCTFDGMKSRKLTRAGICTFASLMIRFILTGAFLCTTVGTHGQDRKLETVCIGFYNLENLFDTLDTPGVRDEEFTPAGSKRWGTEKYRKKLENLSEVIALLGTEISTDGVAILGVSEIENKAVLEDLVRMPLLKKRNYRIVHYDSPDARGVDVALLYQPKYFQPAYTHSFRLTLPGDTAFKTRDQLLVSGKLLGEKIHFMVSHWPSRRGGQKRSAPKRNAAAALGRSVIDSLLKANPNAKVIYMGDLNDDPVDESVSEYLSASGKQEPVTGTKSSAVSLFNPMWKLYKKGIGTLAWRDNWNLFDQMILTPALLTDRSGLRYFGVKVFNKSFLKQTTGKWQGYPFRTFAGSTWLGGYSDHFPVFVTLVR